MITFTDVINNNPTANTSGYFEELMTSVNSYIKGEYTSGRITGAEYAQVYLGMMQTAMQQAVQYSLQKDLVQAQVNQAEQQTANLVTENGNLVKQGLLFDSEKALKDQQRTNLVAEALNIPKQGLLIDAQKTEITNKALLTTQQIALVTAQTTSEGSQKLVLDAQKDLYVAQKQGFIDKTKIDSAKVIADTYAVQAGVNGAAPGQFDTSAITSRLPV